MQEASNKVGSSGNKIVTSKSKYTNTHIDMKPIKYRLMQVVSLAELFCQKRLLVDLYFQGFSQVNYSLHRLDDSKTKLKQHTCGGAMAILVKTNMLFGGDFVLITGGYVVFNLFKISASLLMSVVSLALCFFAFSCSSSLCHGHAAVICAHYIIPPPPTSSIFGQSNPTNGKSTSVRKSLRATPTHLLFHLLLYI